MPLGVNRESYRACDDGSSVESDGITRQWFDPVSFVATL